jgi:hypothetical protein
LIRGIFGAIFIAGAGAMIGSLFDSHGEHWHAQTLGLIAGVFGFFYGKNHL